MRIYGMGDADAAVNTHIPRWLWWFIVVINLGVFVWTMVVNGLINGSWVCLVGLLNLAVAMEYINSARKYHARRRRDDEHSSSTGQ